MWGGMSNTTLRSRVLRLASELPRGNPLRRKLLAALPEQKVGYGKSALKLAWQADFPETVPCVKCGGDTRHVLTLMEGGDDDAADLHANEGSGGKFWFHDYAAFSLYLCEDIDCGTISTEWDQS